MADEVREFTVQIVSVAFDTTIKGQAKNYQGTEVVYKTKDGELKSKGMAPTVFKYHPELETQLKALQPNDYARITAEKKGNFVNWLSAEKVDAPAQEPAPVNYTTGKQPEGTPAKAAPTPTTVRSNYETPEERAARQVMIVRQSSITAALKIFELGLAAGGGFVPAEADVIKSAKEFEAYVLGTRGDVSMPD